MGHCRVDILFLRASCYRELSGRHTFLRASCYRELSGRHTFFEGFML